MTTTSGPRTAVPAAFHHEAYFYAGEDAFLAGTVPFVEAGLDAGEAILVAVDAGKIDALRSRLGAGARQVQFVEMTALGRNPARIIPAWQDFVEANDGTGRGMRGIGEPAWPGRSSAEFEECRLHESLLNVAFDAGPPWTLLCPYDTAGLDEDVVELAHHTHPHVAGHGGSRPSDRYAEARDPFDRPLPPAPPHAALLAIDDVPLKALRRFIRERSAAAGLDDRRTEDLVLAVCEVAANTARHGAGRGTLRVWRDGGSVVCDVEDPVGSTRWDPLVGRTRPTQEQSSGRGLWIANQLCDLVQIRAAADRTTVRLHLGLG